MNIKSKLLGAALCGAVVTIPVVAEEPSQTMKRQAASAEQKIAQYINGDLFGIQNVKKDANRRIVSVVSIGRAPLTSALSKARAKNQAFKKADANARAEFMKWLTTAVVYTRIDQDDIAIVQHGDSLGDAGNGKASEKSEATELSRRSRSSASPPASSRAWCRLAPA